MVPFELLEIFTQLQQPETRLQGLQALATFTQSAEVRLFGKDTEIGVFLPAQGLPQTMRHGTRWHAFLKQVAAHRFFTATLPAANGNEQLACGIADRPGFAILVCLGVELSGALRDQIAAVLPLVGTKLVVERAAQFAEGHAAAARDANRHANSLNVALDTSRRELQKAFERAERELASRREAEQKLREVDRRKDEFLAMLAHELRNPLAPISTAAELLALFAQDEKRVRQAAEIITRQVQHMKALVDDLLDVSRVTRGLVQLEKEDLDLKLIVNAAIEQARPLIESHKHVLTMWIGAEPLPVHGDRTRLIQAISNLLNNAAKYTPQGGEIALRIEAQDASICISVTDNGVGIEPALLPTVFDLFTQAKRTPDRSQGGLGIGLALVKSIVDLHGGQVVAQSDGPGKGSTFSIMLPRLEKELASLTQAQRDLALSAQMALRVLIVDDNLDAAQTLAGLLEAYGHDVTVKANAKGALSEAEQKAYQLFILDIGLPDMDGYELVRRLHQCETSQNAVFIALSGYGQPHDRALSRTAGFDHHLVKPVDTQQLMMILSEIGR
jgi:signal transduction histidine kinase